MTPIVLQFTDGALMLYRYAILMSLGVYVLMRFGRRFWLF